MKNKKLLAIVGLVIVAVVVLLLIRNNNKPTTNAVVPETQPTAKVSITDDGFVPSTIKIKAGSNIVWTNTGNSGHRVVTNPHSTHDGLPGLDSKSNLPTNGTYSFKFDKAGTYGYHDETDPTHNGTVIVE